MRRLNKFYRAFTMIELLVVMGILATLSTVIVILINPSEMNRRSNDAKRFSEIGMLKSAIDLTIADNDTVPDTDDMYVPLGSVTNIDGKGFNISKYLPSIPTDPSYQTSGTTKALVLDGSGKCDRTNLGNVNSSGMQYLLWGDGDTTYHLKVRMQSRTNCVEVEGDNGTDNTSYEAGKNF